MLNDTHAGAFPTERTDGRQVFPNPAAMQTVYENPPAFVWLPIGEDTAHNVTYRVTVWDAQQQVVFRKDCTGNTCVPTEPFSPGAYTWDVAAPAFETSRGVQPFVIAENAIRFSRPTADEIFAGIPDESPRHLFTKADIPRIIADHAPELQTLRRNIALAYQDGLPARPYYHHDEKAAADGASAYVPYREYFGRFRDFCDRNLVACALGYHLLGDETAGAFAKQLFLHLCDWNPLGPCALTGPWGDEVGLSCARCFPAVFDLLKPLLDPKQRAYCAMTTAAYAQQCEERLLKLDYLKNPGDSHAGRLPAYLGEAALSLWGEAGQDREKLRRWLDYALRIYGGLFPFFGTPDGGWAEGTFYSTSYTKWYLPFFSAVARFSGKSLSDRPFYRNYARFLLHFALPDHEIHPFGDGYWCSPDSPEWPGFFAQNPFRVYADLSGSEEAKAYDRQLSSPEIFKLHLLDVFLPAPKTEHDINRYSLPVTDADAFPDAGFISLHSDHTSPISDLHLMARASKFGPGSHRQPDNGSFALFAGGTAMIAPSGYFGRAYGTKHHMQWYNTTRAHNAILVDGIGQDYKNFQHTAKIVSCGIEDGVRYAVLDMSASYPMLTKWVRTFRMTDAHTVVISDEIIAEKPVAVTYPLHTLSRPEKDEKNGVLTVSRGGHTLTVTPDAGCFASVTLSDHYDVDLNEGEPEQFHVTMPEQFHAYYETERRTEHFLSVTYTVN